MTQGEAGRNRKHTPPANKRSAWNDPADDVLRWIEALPLPAFCLTTDNQSIHGNPALHDWLVAVDAANIYADLRVPNKLKALFPSLIDLAKKSLASNDLTRQAFEWRLRGKPLTGELCCHPISGAAPNLVVGWLQDSGGQQHLVDELKARMGLVRMLSDISARAIMVEDLEAFLDECMWLIGRATGVGGVFLWEFDRAQNSFSNISEWMQEGIPSQKEQLQNIPGDSAPDFLAALRNHQIMAVADTRSIDEPVFRDVLEMMGIVSILIIPLFIKNNLYGFLGFEEYRHRREWNEAEVAILKAASEILVRAIENKLVEKELDDYRANLEAKVQKRTAELERINRDLIGEVRQREAMAARLKESEAELEHKSQRLAEVNAALRVLLNQLQEERRNCEETAYRNYTELVEPKLLKLRNSGLSPKQKTYLELIEKNIKQIYVADRCYLMPEFKTLTANEIQVAELIRSDKTSKEIAELMNIALRTVEVYRYNIRKKLGLNKRKASLRDYLRSLES